MGRIIGGVVAGYVVIFLAIMGTFTGAYLAMGAGRAFQPGTYEVSGLWIGMSFVLGFIAALAGGLVCAVVGRKALAVKVLAGLVLVLGLVMAIPVIMESGAEPPPRAGDVPNLEAMQGAKQPAWIALLNPFVGAIGVWIGGGRARREGD